jgi:maleate isomerase
MQLRRAELLAGASLALAGLGNINAAEGAPAKAKRIGTLGLILPTHTPAFLNDLSTFLPPGVAIMPVYLDMTQGTRQEFESAMPAYEKWVSFLAGQGCDLISAGGAPPFMMAGYTRESVIVSGWEKKYGTPVVTSPQDQVNALRALGIKRFIGVTPLARDQSPYYTKYFTDAGFTVLGMEGLDATFESIKSVTPDQIVAFIKTSHAKYPGAEAVYVLGSEWRSADIVDRVERELGIPVLSPVIAQGWEIQKRLHQRWPVRGYGRLISELP